MGVKKNGKKIRKAQKERLRDYEAAQKARNRGAIEQKLRKAQEFADKKVFPVIRPLNDKGITDGAVWATALNTAGVATPTGHEWDRKRLKNYLTIHPL